MRLFLATVFAACLSTTVFGATFTVTNTNDIGPGSLRQAILDANGDSNTDIIAFNIPGATVQTIAVASPLPPVTAPVVIDGFTQPGSSPNSLAVGNNAEPRIELNGATASQSGSSRGIDIRAPGCTVRGLIINRFNADGIAVGSPGNHVAGCFIGTNAAGTVEAKNGSGIWIQPGAMNNRIGGIAPADRNLISGNLEALVVSGVAGGGLTNNLIEGNQIGTDKSGFGRVLNIYAGIVLDGVRGVRIGGIAVGARNFVSGSITLRSAGGVNQPSYGSSDNVIEGNYLGLKPDGTYLQTALIELSAACKNNRIGGSSVASRNVITYGVLLTEASDNLIQGNYIGTDATGLVASQFGGVVQIKDRSAGADFAPGNNIVDSNVIAAGVSGIEMIDASGNTIQRNLIGVGADGITRLPTRQEGIRVVRGRANVIGGTGEGMGNVIAYSGTGPIPVSGISCDTGNRINGNSIYGNSGLGINLTRDGEFGSTVTKNDLGDVDQLQNFPVLTSATESGSTVRLKGTLNSTPNITFRIELFSNDIADPIGHGEGQFYLGFTSVTTDGAGNASFDATLPHTPGARVFSATATGPTNGTSEFSPSFLVGKLQNISTRAHVRTGDFVMIAGFIISGNEPRSVILRGIGPSLEAGGAPFAGRLEDPVLELFDANRVLLASNDNWRETQQAEIEQTGIPPKHEREAAIVRTLAPGNYTVVTSGKNNTTGVAVVEAYDLNSAAVSRIANLSTRAYVETGERVMIAGVIIGGNEGRARVLVRGIAPSLFLSSALQDPMLELYDANGALRANNDDWKSDQGAIEATGAPPVNDREAALLADLEAGSYTAIIRGKNQTFGVALVEVYHLQ